MPKFPEKLHKKLQNRRSDNSYRDLTRKPHLVDFSSNDYLGFSKNLDIPTIASKILMKYHNQPIGATGSRLLSGNHKIHEDLELYLADFYGSESALLFNSGYDANLGVLATIPQRGDTIVFDELSHASIRDGIRLSNAKAFKFKHNDLADLARVIGTIRNKNKEGEIYVITESVFSMDGDSPDLLKLIQYCSENNSHLIIDEAHAVGIYENGLVASLGLEKEVFARIVTFGKAFGVHGASVLGGVDLRNFLINFARSFIYTTALSPHSAAMIWASHKFLQQQGKKFIQELNKRIKELKLIVIEKGIQEYFCLSDSAIQVCKIAGNDRVKSLSNQLEQDGFDVRPILSPTVPDGGERLRFCLHTFNTENELKAALEIVNKFLMHEE